MEGRVSPPPMLAIEPYILVELISGTKIGDRVNSWRQTHSSAYQSNKNPKLGMAYLIGFMKRNKELVTAKQRGVKFESKRADWCTYNNFEAMFE
jgi:hypothetical protein